MRTREAANEYGTPVVGYCCETCGMEFTVCPAPTTAEDDQWRGCMVPPCASYDPGRDADKWFDEATVYASGNRLIRCIQGGKA